MPPPNAARRAPAPHAARLPAQQQLTRGDLPVTRPCRQSQAWGRARKREWNGTTLVFSDPWQPAQRITVAHHCFASWLAHNTASTTIHCNCESPTHSAHLHEEAEHGEHGEAAVLDLLHLQLSQGVGVVSQTQGAAAHWWRAGRKMVRRRGRFRLLGCAHEPSGVQPAALKHARATKLEETTAQVPPPATANPWPAKALTRRSRRGTGSRRWSPRGPRRCSGTPQRRP